KSSYDKGKSSGPRSISIRVDYPDVDKSSSTLQITGLKNCSLSGAAGSQVKVGSARAQIDEQGWLHLIELSGIKEQTCREELVEALEKIQIDTSGFDNMPQPWTVDLILFAPA
ncbi:hypothetical protein ACFL27_17365, partial [candidate division CSSED10-310 bacterium]